MQAITTIDRDAAARVIGLIVATLIAGILVGAFVVTNLGIGFEGMTEAGQRLEPPASIPR